ncbi:MAG TPA: hypothetical protein VKO85_10915, partial [Wenzhouxiangellaceae bacterium]|nr:hypothetical protein [Wenzhouxiangellaceae bacterium]
MSIFKPTLAATVTAILAAAIALTLTGSVHAQDESQSADQAEPAQQTTEQAGEATAQPPAPEQQQPSLEQAYQREFAFLQGQKRDLEQRLAQMQETVTAEKSRLQSDIRSLEAEVVEMRSRADRLEDLVFESERAVEAARENTDLLAATFTQADFTLDEAWNSELGDRAPGAADVKGLFDAALAFLDRGHEVWREPGEFFLADGTRVDGEIIHVGNVAAYGLSERGSGALAPAGDGELKIWNTETAEQAQALASGRMPDSLPIFLFESLNAEVEKKTAKGLFETVSSGGVIGWVIFFLGLVGLMLVLLRVVFLQRAGAS